MNATQSPSFWQFAWKPVLALAILASVVVLAAASWSLFQDMGDTTQAFVYYTVEASDLPIVVTERGNLESQLLVPGPGQLQPAEHASLPGVFPRLVARPQQTDRESAVGVVLRSEVSLHRRLALLQAYLLDAFR